MHVLVIGGTGMLRAATLGISARGHDVSVIARTARRLARLAADAPRALDTYPLDYRDPIAVARAVAAARAARGPVEMVVAWIHGSAPEAPLDVARLVAGGPPVRYLHVRGSAAADPTATSEDRRTDFEALPGVRYEEIVLGFVPGGRHSRWLTHEEISAGVLGVVDAPAARTIVGVVRPWDARP